MAEKRKLPARERREPASKRRVSEATSSKRKASTPVVLPSPTPAPSEIPEDPLPTRIKDGEALPTTKAPQPANLSDKEYQSIAESAVLLASLERSKKKWVSDGILERYWTKPKKAKREFIEKNNPPKESMTKVGACNIVIGPHLFDAMLYTVKDPDAQQQLQYMPPQRPPPAQYNHQSTFQQYQPYPHQQSAPPRPKLTNAPPNAPRQPSYPSSNSRPPPPQPPPHPQRPAQHAPSHPAQHQSIQQPVQPPKPSPDPVIQMLATRAASDPDLKALMRVVASSKASQEQLRAFQAHIDELNAIIRAREQQRQQAQAQAHAPNRQQPPGAVPQPSSQQSQQPTQLVDGGPPRPQAQQTTQSQIRPSAQQETQQQTSSTATPPQQQQASQQSHMNRQEPVQPHGHAQSLTDVHPSPNGQSPAPSSHSQPSSSAPHTPSITVEIKREPVTNAPTVSEHRPIQVQVPRSSMSSPAKTHASPSASAAGQPTPAPHPLPTQTRPSPAHSVQQTATQRPSKPYQGHQPSPYHTQPPPQIQSRTPSYGSPTPYYRPAAPPPPPPRVNYKSVVLEFTSPLTPYGSSTSGHAGSGDRYLFPEYSILEWLPGGNTVIASFLLIRKVPPGTPFPLEIETEIAPPRAKTKASKHKKADKDKGKNANEHDTPLTPRPEGEPAIAPGSSNQAMTADLKTPDAATPHPDGATSDKAAGHKSSPGKDTAASTLKEYYQPITFRIFSANPRTLEPLARVVKPADEVRKYMNEIMDRAERAPEGFLALRLPREAAHDEIEKREKDASTPVPGKGISITGGRTRSLKGRALESGEDSGVENNTGLGEEDAEEEAEELKDFYGPPTGLVPLSI